MKLLTYMIGILVVASVIYSCTRENPITPVAEFTTNLTDNSTFAGENVILYLDQAQGEWLTLFSGADISRTYNPDDESRRGTSIDPEADSFNVIYSKAGTFRLTLVAASSGNWAADYVTDTFGIDVTVTDARTSFTKFQIDLVNGVYSEDGSEIYFYDHKNADLTEKRPDFTTASNDAVVTIDGEVQTAKSSVVDFSPLTPGDDEGRPVVYTITAPNGDSEDYTVKYLLREPSSDKVLFSLETAIGTFNADEANKEIKVIHPAGFNLERVSALASASEGAKVFMLDDDGEPVDISEDDERVDFENSGVVTVEAEDLSTQEYDILLYELETIESISFIESDGTQLNPAVPGTINEEDGSIDFTVLSGTDLSTMVVEFTGLTNAELYLGAVELTSGVTVADFSSDPVLQVKATDGTVLSTHTVNINQASK